MKDKIKVSFSRNYGTENLAMTAEILPEEMGEFQDFFRQSVIRQYESVLLTAIPESEISTRHLVERTEAVKKQNDALAALNAEAEKNAKEQAKAKKHLR